jgi:hypothetical protein
MGVHGMFLGVNNTIPTYMDATRYEPHNKSDGHHHDTRCMTHAKYQKRLVYVSLMLAWC